MSRTTCMVLLAAILFVGSIVLAAIGRGVESIGLMLGTAAPLVREIIGQATDKKAVQVEKEIVEIKLTEAEQAAQEALETTQVLLTEKAALESKLAKRNTKPS